MFGFEGTTQDAMLVLRYMQQAVAPGEVLWEFLGGDVPLGP